MSNIRRTKHDGDQSGSELIGGLHPVTSSLTDGSGHAHAHFRQNVLSEDEEDGTPSKAKALLKSIESITTSEVEMLVKNEMSSETKNSSLNVAPSVAAISKVPHSKAILACLNYSFCSVGMILVNKSLASSYNQFFENGESLNIFLVVIQAVIAVICVELCRISGMIENYPPLTMDIAISWAPVNLFFCGMLFTGMASLHANSVPMVTVFKNITNILTTAGDFIWFGSQPEPLVLAAFGIMLVGAVAAAWKDISVTPTGLFWMSMNCFCTAGYVLYMKYATQSIKLTKFGMVYVNNILCIGFLLPVAYILGEIVIFRETEEIHTLDYLVKNLFAGFVGFFLNFASLSCVQATGPTTYAIVGSLNKIPVTALGYILFNDRISGETWLYIGISLWGGFLYSYAKLQSANKRVHKS